MLGIRLRTPPARLAAIAAVATVAATVSAQDASPVGVTAAISHPLTEVVRLSGTVEPHRASVVASEVEGVVEELVAREGDLVRRGGVLARLRRTDLELTRDAREAELREARARLELARLNLERATGLYERGVTSRQDLDAATSESTAWQGRVDRLGAEIARVLDDLERSSIPAPFTGFVVRERTQVGEWMDAGGPVAEMVDLERPEVVVAVPERYFRLLKVGEPARVGFEALPGLEIDGTVTSVIPTADVRARTFPVKVRFDNADHRVGMGMLSRVELILGAAAPAVMVPKDAVVDQGADPAVLRVGDDRVVERVAVTTGRSAGQWTEVVGGLVAGDRVVTRGNERVRPGQTVAPSQVEYPRP